MLFSVGYQLRADSDFVDRIIQNKDRIGEVYFSFDGIPNGRSSDYVGNDLSRFEAEEKRKRDLEVLCGAGLHFNLLLNGNCYGKYALSRAFYSKIGDTVDHLMTKYRLSGVTTTSPLIAKFIKQNFENIKVRASVNMSLEVPEGMEYIKDLFDEFYLKREYNRRLDKIKAAKLWCDENGKRLYGLANSGCLNFCSAHTFHDNLVAHESEAAEMDNCYVFRGQCCEYLSDGECREGWLQKTNFIRPEDVYLYEGFFDGMKLATRVNPNPIGVLDAYIKQSHRGNIFELLEPNHSGLFLPSIIENKNIPEDFAARIMQCDKNCRECNFCRDTQSRATIVL